MRLFEPFFGQKTLLYLSPIPNKQEKLSITKFFVHEKHVSASSSWLCQHGFCVVVDYVDNVLELLVTTQTRVSVVVDYADIVSP